MTIELTAEEIVTNLLSSNEILERTKTRFYQTTPDNLGEYLKKLPKEKSVAQNQEFKKYSFIKDCKWI